MREFIPRVSDVLSILYPDSLAWVPREALDRGTRLHRYLEFYVNSLIQGVPPPPMENLDEDEQMRATAMMDWLATQQIQLEAAEERVSHHFGFKGHPDLLGTWKRLPWAFDYKFADTLTEQNEFQGEAYRRLTGRSVALIQCKQDGTIICKKLKPRPDLWAHFLSALNVLKFHQKHKETTYVH